MAKVELERLYEKSGKMANRCYTGRKKWLKGVLSRRLALPKTHYRGP
jgi:hypothetical protein